MTIDEVRDNVRWATARGPRVTGCDALVVGGVPGSMALPLSDLLVEVRSWGIRRITLHLGVDTGLVQGPLGARVDAVSVVVRSVGEVDAAAFAARPSDVVVPLAAEVLPQLGAIAARLAAGPAPARVVLTWPLVDDLAPPAIDEVVPAIARAVPVLVAAGVSTGVKGIPACRLGGVAPSWRSGNRLYVDADHQKEAALLFFPDVVQFRKDDLCRFCAASPACDGVPAAWAQLGLHGRLEPITDARP